MTDFQQIKTDTPELIDTLNNGKMVIVVDDEDRENEGDLVFPAALATPEAVNFMVTHGRGLLCLCLEKTQAARLGLELQPRRHRNRAQTAFAVTIEARDGITSGISAIERAHTIRIASQPTANADDISTPGHITPIIAREGGVLTRAGHTEASVDLVRLAGLPPAAIICEILNADGTMARRDQLVTFARRHDLRIGTIADLIAHRLRSERQVEKQSTQTIHNQFGRWTLHLYKEPKQCTQFIALTRGQLTADHKPLVRVHRGNLVADYLAPSDLPATGAFAKAMAVLAQHPSSALILLPDLSGRSLESLLDAQDSPSPNIKLYGIGAQILNDLGVTRFTLLSQAKLIPAGLEGFGLSIDDYMPL